MPTALEKNENEKILSIALEIENTLYNLINNEKEIFKEFCEQIAEMINTFGYEMIENYLNDFLLKKKSFVLKKNILQNQLLNIGDNLPKNEEMLPEFFKKVPVQKCKLTKPIATFVNGIVIQSYNILTKRPIKTNFENCIILKFNDEYYAFSSEPSTVHLSENFSFPNVENFKKLSGIELINNNFSKRIEKNNINDLFSSSSSSSVVDAEEISTAAGGGGGGVIGKNVDEDEESNFSSSSLESDDDDAAAAGDASSLSSLTVSDASTHNDDI